MKKIILFFAGMMALGFSSCSDMLDVDGGRQVEMPDLTQKTDSLFYVAGIMEAMQHAAEVYVIQNELRGDLATTTIHSDRNLQELADFSATSANKYDSAYVYYKVVNNCNYYLAHRDTALYDGATNVTLDEYAAVLSFRAWAYLQLARTYGKVKFFTEPMTSLSQIQNNNSPELDIYGITNALAPELIRFKSAEIPYSGKLLPGGSNEILSRLCIPVDVILGDLYLEAGDYANAARNYYDFLFKNKIFSRNSISSFSPKEHLYANIPRDFGGVTFGSGTRSWSSWISSLSTVLSPFDATMDTGILTYVPMASTSLMGYTSELSILFGYNPYYLNSHGGSFNKLSAEEYDSVFVKKQIVPSDAYNFIADSTDYYYQTNNPTNPQMSVMKGMGDMRARSRVGSYSLNNVKYEILGTYVQESPYVFLYRPTTIWLHLAEALNRMGYPDAAFAILKDGITDNMKGYSYVREETWNLLTTTLPFCSEDGRSEQSTVFSGSGTNHNYGIHRHGCSDNYGTSGDKSLYRMTDEVVKQIVALKKSFGEEITFTAVDRVADSIRIDDEIKNVLNDESLDEETKAEKLAELNARMNKLLKEKASLGNYDIRDVINAVEDILCDEYAMEFAFEGNRFADLMRLARNKNGKGSGEFVGSPASYGSNFGGRWLAKKLAFKNPVKNLEIESNWYLPFN
ncbi:RagB/SusD family nutrient uptake outer membrane protein [Xylanibacter rodentium]|uniref:RagB/SusD family nutrient uptake outer membrane protein n=1 Tax=Xylanibacter rodentium TaxID=2736289 RepID=UPI00258D553B|nr:RagB/SusD family nutrient uptake outer membrane protein [Xylanibacter rodentium]